MFLPRLPLVPAAQAPVAATASPLAQADLQSKLDSFRWYPVVQLGVGYRF